METAPKDGREILLNDGWAGIVLARWGFNHDLPGRTPQWVFGESYGEFREHNSARDPAGWTAPPLVARGLNPAANCFSGPDYCSSPKCAH